MARPLTAIAELAKYLFKGTGIFGTQVQQAHIILHSSFFDEACEKVVNPTKNIPHNDPASIPDVEIMFLPISPTDQKLPGVSLSTGTFAYLCTVLTPKSTGTVRLTSASARDQPLCDIGTLSHPEDRIPLRKALKFSLALRRRVRAGGYPIEDILVPSTESDVDLDSFTNENLMTTYHYSSTCRMADEIDQGVVDDELRVYGISGLRIADASIFPQIPACHLQAPVVMVAERCADFVTKNADIER